MLDALLHDNHRRHLALTVLVGAGLAAYLTGTVESIYGFDLAMLLALLGGFPIYFGALSWLLRGKITADLAVALAAAAAIAIGEYLAAAEVILIMLIGESLENFAIGRTRAGIAALLALRPEQARVRRDEDELTVDADGIYLDDVVLLRPGERVPVDGIVLAGHSSIDQSPITGESLPVDKAPSDEVFAGTLNLHGAIEVEPRRLGRQTTLAQIIHLVEHAEAAKAPTQRLADRWAGWFVPIVLLIAAIVFAVTRDPIRSVAVLVVACPCALVLATPAAIAAGLGALVRRGILIKGGMALEKLGRLRAVVFDKTGTLTTARLQVGRVATAEDHSETDVLRWAAAVEQHSEHPIGKVIVERARQHDAPLPAVAGFVAHPGLGAEATVDGARVQVGNARWMEQTGAAITPSLESALAELAEAGCTAAIVARDGRAIGAIGVRDTVRAESRAAVAALNDLGVQQIEMLTGDAAGPAYAVAETVGIGRVYVHSGLLPADKVARVRHVQDAASPVAMVGDGVNDAPSLVAADVGVAMADIGADVAIEAADVVLIGDDPRKLADAVDCGRRAIRIIWQNIIGFAVLLNIAAVAVASAGWLSPVAAALLHQVGSLVVVLNSLRLLIDWHAWRRWLRHVHVAVVRRRRQLAAAAAALLVAAYAASGLFVVGVGEVAVVLRCGRVVQPAAPPGLHWRLPRPLGRHFVVAPDRLQTVAVGFRMVRDAAADAPALEWETPHQSGSLIRQPEEAEVWTGDEKLLDVNLAVHYRLTDPQAAVLAVGADRWDDLVRRCAESALHLEMAQRPIDDALVARRADLEAAMHARLGAMLDAMQTGLQVHRVCLTDVHPPTEVVPAFRDVAAAQEEKEATINEAQAYQGELEALSRGRADRTLRQAEGDAAERTARAQGDADRFRAIAAAHAAARDVDRIRLYLETVEQTLAGRRKVILDARAGRRRRLLLGPQGLWNFAAGADSASEPAEPQPPESMQP